MIKNRKHAKKKKLLKGMVRGEREESASHPSPPLRGRHRFTGVDRNLVLKVGFLNFRRSNRIVFEKAGVLPDSLDFE